MAGVGATSIRWPVRTVAAGGEERSKLIWGPAICPGRGRLVRVADGSRTRERDSSNWETVAWFGVDSGTCAIGDVARLGTEDRLSLELGPSRAPDAAVLSELALVVCGTGADRRYPLEIAGHDPPAARVCFTNDVDQLAGDWTPVGEVVLGGACMAGDPFCTGDVYRVSFSLPSGACRAEVFRPTENDWDCLGLRVVAVDTRRQRS